MLREPDARKEGYRVGLLGGTFDPPHTAHLVVAEWARDALALDEVWFVPAHVPPWKRARVVASPAERLAMLRLAVSGRPYLAVQTVEYERPGPSYTADTLASLRRRYPGVTLSFFWGATPWRVCPFGTAFPGSSTWRTLPSSFARPTRPTTFRARLKKSPPPRGFSVPVRRRRRSALGDFFEPRPEEAVRGAVGSLSRS